MFEVIGKPLFEAAAQTFVGAIAGYTFEKMKDHFYRDNTFDGAFDLWERGIHHNTISRGDSLAFDGLLSPYVQLFPRDPYNNATRWNSLYNFEGKISSQEFSKLEFYAGSDETIRTGSLNGETLVGLYNRYGYIGEGMLGVISTSYLLKRLPDFFSPSFWGCRARITGTLSYCPAQHGFVAQSMFAKAGLNLETDQYREIPYIKINSIKLFNRDRDRISSLLGSPWAATDKKEEPYLVQYGYFSNATELSACNNKIVTSPSWDSVKVFYDTLTAPSPSLTFSKNFIG
ncbi:hypothetical protein [Pseudoflavonifractor sp. An85]|uniref:hypothetical protein n=1 Tax=Pseudoflavonifractor sp. An85 TaxID=1965661 RepID=UPI00117AA2F6|nr:hypothetical protein [Pseudoflavonifractor sp. An85]